MRLGRGDHLVARDSLPQHLTRGVGVGVVAGAQSREARVVTLVQPQAQTDPSEGQVAHSGLGQVGAEVTDTVPEGVLTGLRLC